MLGFMKKASRAKSIAMGSAGASKLTSSALTATAVGVAGTAAVSSPASQEIKTALGYGPDTSLIRTTVGEAARSHAAPPGKDYGGGSAVGPTTGAIAGAGVVGGVAGGLAVPSGGTAPKPTFQVGANIDNAAQATKAAARNPGRAMRAAGKMGVNATTGFFGRSSTLKGLGGAAGAAAGMALAGRAVDRLARKVVRTGTPHDNKLPDPTQPKASSTRTPTTARGVSRTARATGGPTGSMVLDLHKTGGSGGVMT